MRTVRTAILPTLQGDMRPHAKCTNTAQKQERMDYAGSGLQAEMAGYFGEPSSGAGGAREIDVVHLASRADDAVQRGHDRLVEMLVGDL